ncbi:MAG TPA: hypothetical protein VF521_02495, partial [Pyrinomonadaceae bacterium]
MRLKNIPAFILLFQLLLNPFAPLAARADEDAMRETSLDAYEPGRESGGAAEKRGLRFRLSEGVEAAERPEARPPAAKAERLSDSEAARVLARLPEIKTDAADAQEFALRERSLPAPRAGATVLKPFPAPEPRESPDANVSGDAKVLRHSPEGEVPLAPQVSLTFSRPMVAVTSQEAAALSVPAQLSPQAAGRWRWLGTKTLIFDPEGGRLPMATEFTVMVPGREGLAPAMWRFATPAPKLVQKYPDDVSARRDAVVFMEFDQRVEPAAVLRGVKLQAGGAAVQVRLATEDEIRRDENVKGLVASATGGRWVALRAAGELPANSPVSVTVGAGTPSAEGPRRTTAPQGFSFRTYGPLRVTQHRCGWQPKTCSPYDQWSIEFSNSLDRDAFDPARVKVEPAVPGLNVYAAGGGIYMEGQKRGRTNYKVTLDANLRDEFGQTLGSPVTLDFNVGPAPPGLFAAGSNFVVLDHAGGPNLSVFSVNQPSLKVSLYAVTPEDFATYVAHMRSATGYYDERQKKPVGPPGRLVSTKSVPLNGRPDEMTETRLDLSPALKDGRGNVFVVVEPAVGPDPKNRRRGVDVLRVWAQLTSIGLDAFVDRDDLVGWATSLSDG